MKNYFLFLFLVGCVAFSYSQSVRGTVIDEISRKPIGQAKVFFDNTTYATNTDSEGKFEIKLPLQPSNQLIVVADSYDYQIISNVNDKSNLLIRLKNEETVLDEIVIDKSPFTRKEMLKAFKTYFLGTTPNGKNAKIKNEKVLYFNFDTKTNTLTAYSDKPIEIENKNLGYSITFYLKTFQVQFNTRSLESFNYQHSFFSGYTQFKDSNKISSKLLKNREETSKLSYVNFFRELIIDDLEKDFFVLGVDRYKVNPSDYFDIQESANGYSICLTKKPMKEIPDYSKNSQAFKKVPTNFDALHLTTKKQSIFQFNVGCLLVDFYGNIINPEQISFGGYFGDLKIADMLPLDYYQEKLKRNVNNNLPIIDENYTYEAFEKEAVDFYTSNDYVNHEKARQLFLDKLQATYDLKVHEPFDLWIVTNIKTTQFVSKEEALTHHSKFVETYKLISKKKKEIELKENHFAKKYGDAIFNKMYVNSILRGILVKRGLKIKEE